MAPHVCRDLRIYAEDALADGAGSGTCRQLAAAELAAIPDSEALRAGDEAITRGDQNDDGEALGTPMAQIERMARHFDDGSQPDLANASLAELFAFCLADEKLT